MVRNEGISLEFKGGAKGGAPVHDLSAGARAGDTLFVAGDEGASIQRLHPNAAGRWTQAANHRLDTLIELPGGDDSEIDIEGMAISDGWLWVTGSHALTRPKPDGSGPAALRPMAEIKRSANRYLLARFPLIEPAPGRFEITAQIDDRHAGSVEAGKRSSALMRWLDGDGHLGPFLALPAKENGFDIEGLAVHGQTVWLGLRSPVLRNHAVVLWMDLRERRHGLLKARKTEGGRRYRKFLIDLDGLGIRDLLTDGDDLLILAGPAMTTGDSFRIFRWRNAAGTDTSQVVSNKDLSVEIDLDISPELGRPEAIIAWRPGQLLMLRDGAATQNNRGRVFVSAEIIDLPE